MPAFHIRSPRLQTSGASSDFATGGPPSVLDKPFPVSIGISIVEHHKTRLPPTLLQTRIALAFHCTRGPRPEVPVTCRHDLRGWYAMLRLNCILHG
jgi:hypothetical protein